MDSISSPGQRRCSAEIAAGPRGWAERPMPPVLPSLPAAAPRRVCQASPIRCVPAIRLIAQTSFPRAAEPVRGRVLIPHTGDNPPGHGCSGSNAGPVPVGRDSRCSAGHPDCAQGWHPPGSCGEPRAFPASLGEITREKWGGKLLMSRGWQRLGGQGRGWGLERVCSCPLCCVSRGRGSHSTPQDPCLSPRRDLKNNLISTVQPGAFLGLPELKRL